jgi:hypothetical protein
MGCVAHEWKLGTHAKFWLEILINKIKTGLRETGCEDIKWIKMTQNRVQQYVLVMTVKNF